MTQESAGRGMSAIAGDKFSFAAATGGLRGVVESLAPGLLFVVVYLVANQKLLPAAIAAGSAAGVMVVLRLIQRTPITQAMSGVIGVAVGLVWAMTSGKAENFFAWGLWTNAGYLVGTIVSILVGWPLVGLVLGLFSPKGPLDGGSWSAVGAFRRNRAQHRRANAATGVLAAVFGLRLLVQVPLYLNGEVAWLGTAKLLMGLPLFAVALWISWVLVRSVPDPEQLHQHPDR